MELDVKVTVNAANEKKAQITRRNKALAIRRCFMRPALLRERPLCTKTDTEVDCQDKIDATKAKEAKSVHGRPSKENTNKPKRKRQDRENEHRAPKQGNLDSNYADDQSPGPLGAWSCNISPNPMKLVLKKAVPTKPKEQNKHHQTEMYEPTEWDYLDELSRLPLDAPVPDPDLSFLKK